MFVQTSDAAEPVVTLRVCVQTIGSPENNGDLNIHRVFCKNGARSFQLPTGTISGARGPRGETGDPGPAGPKGATGPGPALNWWTDVLSPIVFLLIGAGVSFYATVVFERSKRFREMARALALMRLYNDGSPFSSHDIARAYPGAIEFWRKIEDLQWGLDAEGHHNAAKHVARLTSFAANAARCIEYMLDQQEAGKSVNNYLSSFTGEYARIQTEEFTRFEDRLKPSKRALLMPRPHATLPSERGAGGVGNYFERLLNDE
jgi:hypothetical protein